MNHIEANRTHDDAPCGTIELINKIQSMTKEELDLFIYLASKELGLQLN